MTLSASSHVRLGRMPLPHTLCSPRAQIALLRDYLDAEFRPSPPPGKAKAGKKDDATLLPFGYDLERIIDDFVFICMLVRPHSCKRCAHARADVPARWCAGGQRFFATAAHA